MLRAIRIRIVHRTWAKGRLQSHSHIKRHFVLAVDVLLKGVERKYILEMSQKPAMRIWVQKRGKTLLGPPEPGDRHALRNSAPSFFAFPCGHLRADMHVLWPIT